MTSVFRRATVLCATALSLAAFSSCSNDPTLNNGGDTSGANLVFQQIDRIGKPGLKELYLPYATHDGFDRTTPSGDLAAYGPGVSTFASGTAGRSAAVAAYARALLLPDVLVANLAVPATTASYLGWETGGGIKDDCTGAAPNAFGGRGLNDDVVDTMLGLAFGTLATTANPTVVAGTNGLMLTRAADDGKERDGRAGTPQLASDDVTCVTKGVSASTFPYLADPL